MPSKNIYVSPKDVETWEEAERLARADDRSLSVLITRLLREYISKKQPGKR